MLAGISAKVAIKIPEMLQAITCSKLTIKALEQGVNYVRS